MTEQKKIFLQSEGNAWFNRNKQALSETSLPDQDRILPDLLELPLQPNMKVLEVGCGNGNRLVWLKENLTLECSGIDPSAQAIEVARSRGIDAYQSWLAILDFFAQTPISRPYRHFLGISSYKMDYPTLFDWHPAYICMTHKVQDHVANRSN